MYLKFLKLPSPIDSQMQMQMQIKADKKSQLIS